MAMMNRNFLLSKIRPLLISSSFPKSHTFCTSSTNTSHYFFCKIPPIEVFGISPPSVLSDAKSAAKAWDAKMQVIRNAAGVKFTEANVHFAAYEAIIHAGESPDSAATVAKFSEAEASVAEVRARFAEAEALISEGEASVAKGKTRVAELKVQIKEVKKKIGVAAAALDEKKREAGELEKEKSKEAERNYELYKMVIMTGKSPDSRTVKEVISEAKRRIAALEDTFAPIKERIKTEEASILESKAQLVELEARAVEFEALTAVMEAGVIDLKAGMAEMKAQARNAELAAQVVARCARNHIAERVKQRAEFEAKIAEIKKKRDSAAKTGIWERVRRFFV